MKTKLIIAGFTMLILAAEGAFLLRAGQSAVAPPKFVHPTTLQQRKSETAADAGNSSGVPKTTLVADPGGDVGVMSVDPPAIYANSTTTVTFVCDLASNAVIPASVILQQTDSSGNVIATVGNMMQVPSQPTFYTATVSLNPSTISTLFYKASVGYRGVLRRVTTRLLWLSVTPLDNNQWLAFSSTLGYALKYPPNWVLAENEGTATITHPQSPGASAIEGVYDIMITSEANPANLTVAQYFDGVHGTDLFTGTQFVSSVLVGGHPATRFSGIPTSDDNDVVVIPMATSFLVINSKAPEQIFETLLSSVQLAQ
jgi:hypothetical protein